ncbi:MAG: glycosyltransferase family 9 protein [Elusimicrobiota bacterium]|nr:glycosyltransferase family 9 protein [Elusimicrobiota bacterium]
MTKAETLLTLARSALLWAAPRAAPAARPRRVLVLGYGAVGDTIFFLPFLEALKKELEPERLVFLANASPVTRELVPATGLVDEVMIHELDGGDRAGVNAWIRAQGFDLAVLSLSSPADYFQPALAGVPLRAGHLRVLPAGGSLWARLRWALVVGEFARRALLNRAAWIREASEPASARNLRLLSALGLPPRPAAERPRLPLGQEQRGFAATQLGPKTKRRVGVHLGPPVNQYHKIWDAGRFGELLARLSALEPLDLFCVGGPGEEAALEKARAAVPGLRSWAGRASLLETFALIETCDLFLSCDTGLAKAAAALGVPTVTLWGLSDTVEVGHQWELEKHLDVRTGIACSPCARLGMAVVGKLNYLTCGHHACLQDMSVPFVYEAIKTRHFRKGTGT